jgi:hypothetical protein
MQLKKQKERPMDCRHFRFAILDIARNETQIPDEVRNHFENCPACKREFQRQTKLTSSLKNLREHTADLQPPAELQQTLLTKFHRLQNKKSKINILWIGRIAAAFVCISLVSALVWRLKQQSPTTPTAEKPAIQSREITSGFIPLMHGELAGNGVQIVRVRLPRSSLLDLGFPVNMDRPDEMIEADVVLGEEGLPHAIRLIQQSNSVIDFQEEK